MKKCDLLQECFAKIPADIHEEIDLSFAIVDRIHEILKRQNKTQKDLAIALGKSESEISKWMRGTHNFTTRTLAKISSVLGERIIDVAGKRPKTNIEFNLYVPVYYKIPKSGKESTIGNVEMGEPINWQSFISGAPDSLTC